MNSASGWQRVRIDDIAFGGRGVGRLEDGRALFVPFVVAGETVRVEIVRGRRNYVEARLLAVEAASPERVEPPCPYFGRCGGCSYQHMSAAEQLRVKERQVEAALRRIGRLATVPMRAIVASPLAYAYRNRITVHYAEGRVGFFAAGRREIVDIAQCPLAQAPVNAALSRFRAGRPGGDGHCTLRAVDGRRSFEQTNDGAAAELLRLVGEMAGEGAGRLIDAYCGAGFFLKALRGRFTEAIGLEWDRWAVAAAEASAGAGERYVCGDVGQLLEAELTAAGPGGETVVICDPPAEGLSTAACEALRRHPPRALIYVSCDPATLARDLARLSEMFVVATVQPLDMFPQTAEIEAVVKLERRS